MDREVTLRLQVAAVVRAVASGVAPSDEELEERGSEPHRMQPRPTIERERGLGVLVGPHEHHLNERCAIEPQSRDVDLARRGVVRQVHDEGCDRAAPRPALDDRGLIGVRRRRSAGIACSHDGHRTRDLHARPTVVAHVEVTNELDDLARCGSPRDGGVEVRNVLSRIIAPINGCVLYWFRWCLLRCL